MTLTYHDPSCEIHQGHVLDVLAEMPAESVDCCITSPPYWALRKYTGEQVVKWADGSKAALGLEPTPELYLSHLLDIFRAVRRVLRPWGTCWVNIGDSYAANRSYQVPDSKWQDVGNSMSSKVPNGLKPLDLCGIPESLVLALRADGWYWRSTIIWAKTNPMPESISGWRWERHKVKVGDTQDKEQYIAEQIALTGKDRHVVAINWGKMRSKRYLSQKGPIDNSEHQGEHSILLWADCPGCPTCTPNDGLVLRKGSWRPTSSFEYVFMLAKSKDYFCDGEAVRERTKPWEADGFRHGNVYTNNKSFVNSNPDRATHPDRDEIQTNRNLRDVWTINTQPFPGAHFATFPEELVKKPILASTSDKGNCPKCGMPWVRVIKRISEGKSYAVVKSQQKREQGLATAFSGYSDGSSCPEFQTLSWRPSCSCGVQETVPAVILDPFCGSGTTLAVAKRLGRHAIGIDLSGDYCQMAQRRVEQETVPFKEP